MFKNLSQLKKYLKKGMQYEVVENAIKPQNSGAIRTIKKVHTNSIEGDGVWLYWQKAKDTRINEDGTIDFLMNSEIVDKWTIEQQTKENKDYWLKLKIIA